MDKKSTDKAQHKADNVFGRYLPYWVDMHPDDGTQEVKHAKSREEALPVYKSRDESSKGRSKKSTRKANKKAAKSKTY